MHARQATRNAGRGGALRENSSKNMKKRNETLICKDVLIFLVTVDIAICELKPTAMQHPPFLPFVIYVALLIDAVKQTR